MNARYAVRVTRQRKILDVAAQLFHEKGFHGVGIDEIGRQAGVSGPAVYRHFKGKDEILLSELILNPSHSILTQSFDSRLRLVRSHRL